MKIQFCSDLHLEFPENARFLSKNPLELVGDILVIAGDMVTFHDMKKARDFIDIVSDQFSAVYWIPGNHEYYGSDIADKPSPLYERIRDNVFLVNNQSIVDNGVRLVFSTLWSRISPVMERDLQRSLSDFSAIQYKGGTFTAGVFTMLHEECMNFLRDTFRIKLPEPTVVVTHHVPTLINYPSVYRNSRLTEAFAVELSDFIADAAPDYWIYGHHHINVPDFKVDETIMVTNQLGYVSHYEHGSFRRSAMIRVGGGQ